MPPATEPKNLRRAARAATVFTGLVARLPQRRLKFLSALVAARQSGTRWLFEREETLRNRGGCALGADEFAALTVRRQTENGE